VKSRYSFKRPLLILILYILSPNSCLLYSAQEQTHKTIEELYPGLTSEALLWATPARMNRGILLSSGKLIIEESEVVRVLNQSAPAVRPQIEVLIISLREERILAERFGVQTIPDIILFDRQGREVFRHVGFLPERSIEEKLKAFGLI
jgi:hypothetical protein